MESIRIKSRHIIRIHETTKNHNLLLTTDNKDIEIDNCCRDCDNWDEETEEKRYNGDVWRACKILDNDFCCGGSKEVDAGVIGGGGFRTKEWFFCKYWKIRRI